MSIKDFSEDKKIISDYYGRKIEKYKNGPEIVGWSKRGQLIRFEILSEIGDLKNKKILDIGCGLGDFYEFLTKNKGIKLKGYLGIDANPILIERAKRKYPKANFEVRDLLKNPIKNRFDYVFESGIFGVETPNWQDMTKQLLIRMFDACKIGVAANFLSDSIPFKKTSGIHYENPSNVLDFVGKNLSSRTILKHDYLPHDFTIYIYKKLFNIF